MNQPAQRPTVGLDVVFVGVTRPAMRFGVPYAALIVNALITLELFLLTRNLHQRGGGVGVVWVWVWVWVWEWVWVWVWVWV